MTKCDYLKGVTAGLSLMRRIPKRHLEYKHSFRHELDAVVRKAEDKYRDSFAQNDSLGLPSLSSDAWERARYYAQGVRDAFEYGSAQLHVVCRYNGMGHYTVSDLADQRTFVDPSEANKRAWELDPQGHDFTSKPILWVNGASKHFADESLAVEVSQ